MNLILNAAEAFPDKHGDITISTRTADPSLQPKCVLPQKKSSGRCVVLEVRDNGIGMDQATLARIFEPFFTTKFLGRGLGLAAAQGIVHARGGVIDVESTPGKGTQFTLYFPADAAGESAKAGITTRVESGKKGTILVVDDEEVVRATAKAILERRDHRVLVACDGHEGVKIFKENRDHISAVLLDLTMPGMSGDEVLRAIREINAGIPVIISSGYNESEIMILFQGRNVDGFIQKPYLATRLIDQVNRALTLRNVPENHG
jgi:two-component system, cell cycle sensor histidine kinase and response regulator CckA